jgi:hypothetical protein
MRFKRTLILCFMLSGLFLQARTVRAQLDSAKLVALAEEGSFSLIGLRLTEHYHLHEWISNYDTAYTTVAGYDSRTHWFEPWVYPSRDSGGVLQVFSPLYDNHNNTSANPLLGFRCRIDTSRKLLIGLYCQYQHEVEVSYSEKYDQHFLIDTIPYQFDGTTLSSKMSGSELLRRISNVHFEYEHYMVAGNLARDYNVTYDSPIDSSSQPNFVFSIGANPNSSVHWVKRGAEIAAFYPNPCDKILHLLTPTDPDRHSLIRIFDLLGRLRIEVPSTMAESLSVGTLEPGSYTIVREGKRWMFNVVR